MLWEQKIRRRKKIFNVKKEREYEMKKIFCVVLSFVMIFALSACGNKNTENLLLNGVTLKVFNWGDYIDENVLTMFEDETGAKIEYILYDSNDAMYERITKSNESFDICIPSDYMIEKMIAEDLLLEIDYNNVPNAANIAGSFRKAPFDAFDPEMKYSVPYLWGILGIVYDSQKVTEEEASTWDILFSEKYDGKIFMYGEKRDILGIGLKSLGYSLNSVSENELNEAGEKLMAQKELVRAYVGDDVKDKMMNGEGELAVMYAGDAITTAEVNPDMKFALPKEGTNVFIDSMVIPKTASNKEAAEMFINFMCRKDIAEMNRAYVNYSTPHSEVIDELPEEKKNDPATNPPADYLEKCELYRDVGQNQLRDELYTKIKAK